MALLPERYNGFPATRNGKLTENTGRRETEERVVAGICFMQQNVNRMLQLRECADRARWSIPHFNMVFKRHVNIPPMEFFARLNMTRAYGLLKTSDLTIREVAPQLGFEDPFYFSRFFRRHQNVSSSRYRKEFSWSRPKQGHAEG
jgi:transcriptional regulator GlxA family with amidase domain